MFVLFFLSLLSLASFLILLAKSRQQNLPKNTCPVRSFHNCLWKIFLIGMTEKLLYIMAYSYCRIRTRIPTQTQITVLCRISHWFGFGL